MTAKFEILSDPEALARRATEYLTAAAHATEERFGIALSGGSTPRRLFELLAHKHRKDIPWDRVHVFWGDERFVPKDDARSNYRVAYDTLISRVPIPAANVHPVPTEGTTPSKAARSYERALKSYYGAAAIDPLRPLFEVTLLGLGEDGHIASLFPASVALTERERWVVAVTEGAPEPRISLTYPPLESSRHVLFLIAGKEKRAIFQRIRRGDTGLPASRLRPVGEVLWLADEAAAGR